MENPISDCLASAMQSICTLFRKRVSQKSMEALITGTMTFNTSDAIIEVGLAGAGLVQLHTYMAEHHLKSAALTQVRPTSLLGRSSATEEIANMVVYVCSEQVSAAN